MIILGSLISSALAQTSDLILLDTRNHYGQFSIDNVHVIEKQYYKIIYIDVHVKVKDLALEDSANAYLDGITLTNENGKKYQSTCTKVGAGTFYDTQTVSGYDGGIGMRSLCYMVEKEFNNFKVYYVIPFYNMNMNPVQIGNVSINQNPVNDVGSFAKNIVNNTSSFAKNIVSNASSYAKNINVTQEKDFFTQLVDWFKNLFHRS